MRFFRLFVAVGLCCIFSLDLSPAFAAFRQDHPRIFVNTDPTYYNCVDSLRERVTRRPCLPHYERLAMWRNSFRDVPRGRKPSNVLPSYAIRWVIDPADTEAADTALAMLMALGRDDGQSWHLSVISITYDWLFDYPGFSQADKKLVRERITSFTRKLIHRMKTDDDVFNNHTWYHLRAVYLAALAVMGEVEEAVQWYSFAETYWKDNLEGAIALFEGGWHEGLSYSTRASLLNMGMWLEAIESASSPRQERFATLAAEQDWLNRFTSFYAAQVMPDGTLARYGDVPEFILDGGWDNSRLFMIIAREYRNGLAAWILERIIERDLELLPLHIWYYLLWYDPGVPVVKPGDVLPKSVRLCPGTYDLFFMRSSWEDDATVVSFHAGDWFGSHNHLDVGHFTIFRKEYLAIDGGVYAPMNASHHVNFSNRTLAHNTLLIHDPQEHFQIPASGSVPIFNDGGQRVVVSLGGRSTQYNFNVDVWKANQLEDAHFERATVLDWYTGEALDFVRADLTKAYNSDFFCAYGRERTNRPKVESVVRSLAFVKPSTVVVYDRVVSREAAFEKTWNLNTARQPYLGSDGVFLTSHGPVKLAGKTFLPANPRREIWGSNSEPFRIAGIDMRHDLDLWDYPEVVPGGWILRISPEKARLADEFFHVLAAGDADQTAQELLSGWRMVASEGARVLTDGSLVLAFPDGSGEEIGFRVPGEGDRGAQVYLLGLPKDKELSVMADGKTIEDLIEGGGILFFGARAGASVKNFQK